MKDALQITESANHSFQGNGEAPAEKREGGRKRILLIEPEELERFVLKKILGEQYGGEMDVIEVKDGNEAFDLLVKDKSDLVVVDLDIPGMSARELIQYVKQKYPETAMLATAACDELKVAQKVMKLRIQGYLLKPIRPETFLNSVAELLGRDSEAPKNCPAQFWMDRLIDGLRDNSYQKCVEAVRGFTLQVYDENGDMTMVFSIVNDFALRMLAFSRDLDIEAESELADCLKTLHGKLLYNKKYNVYLELSKMMDIIFDRLKGEGEYSDRDMKKVLNFIDRNIRKNITLEDAAEAASMSTYYFSKMFKKMTGVNFIAYVTDQKMELAKELLANTSMPVINISYELSYTEANYFSKTFKKKTGFTPSEYREQCKSSLRETGEDA